MEKKTNNERSLTENEPCPTWRGTIQTTVEYWDAVCLLPETQQSLTDWGVPKDE
tara:strand:- start:422 stop:583 length:162 start_codon:yes stop_codon:yes gene_type:complete